MLNDTQDCVKEMYIGKIIEINEYRSDTDFRILSIAFKLNCARTQKNLEKINKYLDQNIFYYGEIQKNYLKNSDS